MPARLLVPLRNLVVLVLLVAVVLWRRRPA
jgi:hypothetical protein